MAWDINTEADYVHEESNKEYFRSSEIYERIKRDFYRKIKVTANGCWDWTSQYNASNGEPHLVFKTPETTEFDARQISYNYHVDTLFAGERITMICGNTICVNPAHMQIERKEVEMEKRMIDIYAHARNYISHEVSKAEQYSKMISDETSCAVSRYESALRHLGEAVNALKSIKAGTPFLRGVCSKRWDTRVLYFFDNEWVVEWESENDIMWEHFERYEDAVSAFGSLK